MTPMTPHEKECALAAIGALLEKAKTTKEAKELRKWLRQILATAPDQT